MCECVCMCVCMYWGEGNGAKELQFFGLAQFSTRFKPKIVKCRVRRESVYKDRICQHV